MFSADRIVLHLVSAAMLSFCCSAETSRRTFVSADNLLEHITTERLCRLRMFSADRIVIHFVSAAMKSLLCSAETSRRTFVSADN